MKKNIYYQLLTIYQIYEEESSMELKTCKGCKFCVAVEDNVGNIKYYCDLDNEEIKEVNNERKTVGEAIRK